MGQFIIRVRKKSTGANAYEAPAISNRGELQQAMTHICSYASSHTKGSTTNVGAGTENIGAQTSETPVRKFIRAEDIFGGIVTVPSKALRRQAVTG